MLPINFNFHRGSDYLFHVILPIVAVCLPPLFISLNLSIMPLITITIERLFTTFGFCMWCVLLIVAYREIRARPGISIEEGVVVLLPLLTSFFFLVLIVEYVGKSWDYENYEDAIRAVILRENPYNNPHYLYPPFFAQSMAGIYRIGEKLFDNEGLNLWLFVFYIHQCAQFFLINLAYQLSSRFGSYIGLSDMQNKIIVTALFLFNFPLIRTLHLNQVNLYILDAALIALLTLNKFPYASGAAVMFGGLIKLYPFIIGVPLVLMRKWKAVFGALISGIVVVLLQTNFGRDLSLWKQFILFLISFPVDRESSLWIRNTTLISLARNLSHFTGMSESMIQPLFITAMLVVLVWIAIRFYKREKIYPTLTPGILAETYRNSGNLIDFTGLALLITPSAWDHHFVIALPLALWAVALRRYEMSVGRRVDGWVGVAIVCIFILPPFDIFPLSYLRMFGVIALLIFTSPDVPLKSSS